MIELIKDTWNHSKLKFLLLLIVILLVVPIFLSGRVIFLILKPFNALSYILMGAPHTALDELTNLDLKVKVKDLL